MSKYKEGDKVVLNILATDEDGYYKLGNEIYSWWDSPNDIDIVSEPLSEYTEKLEKKNENKQKRIEKLVERLHRQAAEITRLLAENEDLKNSMEIIRDNAFEAGQVKGQNDAWELARKIISNTEHGGYGMSELLEIFGTMMLTNILTLTYDEAAAKVAEWERRKEICVGDVIRSDEDSGFYALVINIDKETQNAALVTENGYLTLLKLGHCFKTDRHIDMGWLAQIGGDSE